MAKIFISHSSLDKPFAKKLAEDLTSFSHTPWLDEWEIKVGECIPTKIEKGLTECEFIIVVLSNHSIKSPWVEREWKAKYWDEIYKGKIALLPVVIENCEIPMLLQTKLYADFRTNYQFGFVNLVNSLNPTLEKPQVHVAPVSHSGIDNGISVAGLLSKLHDRSNKLSMLITEILAIAIKEDNFSLRAFCIRELTGWDEMDRTKLQERDYSYRLMPCYISSNEKINFQYIGWNSDPAKIFQYIKNHPDKYLANNVFCTYSISNLEAMPLPTNKDILTFQIDGAQFYENVKPGSLVEAYARDNSYVIILENIRTELTKLLVALI